MLLLVPVLTAIIVIIYLNFNEIFKWTRRYYIYTKLPGINLSTSINLMMSLLKSKESDLFGIVEQLLDVPTHTFSSIIFFKFYTVLLHPKVLEKLLSSSVHIAKGDQYTTVRKWLREGLLTSKGKKWQKRRKTLTPTFHFKILEDSLSVINRNAGILSEKFTNSAGIPLEIEDYILLCTLDTICETAMGVKLDSQKNKAVEYVQDIKRSCQIIIKKELTFWMHSDLLFGLTPYKAELEAAIDRLHSFTDRVISERKAKLKEIEAENDCKGEKKRMAFLDSLIDSELKEPGTFTDLDMREEVDTFMFEGHDTTAAAVTFCLLVLGREQTIQDKVVDELNTIFLREDRAITMEDLQKMKYLEMVIKETLRLYPSVPYYSRFITKDFILDDGTIIPEGSNLGVLPYILHRNPDLYPNPLEFIPERFNEENSKNRIPFSYIPFSAGPRNCIGQKFAMIELKIIVSTILRRNRLESVTDWKEIKLVPRIVLKPSKPVVIRFLPRN